MDMKMRFKMALLALAVGTECFGAAGLPGDSLAADFRFFCDVLEATHPDPYSSFGGRPYFCLARDRMAYEIGKDSLSAADFCDLLNEFIVPLGDMHTFVQYPNSGNADIRYVQRISFDVLNDGLMVSGIAQPHSKFLGSRLLSINGVPADSLAQRMLKVKPSENRFGNMQNLSMWGNQDVILRKLGVDANDSVRYSLLTPEGDSVTVDLPIVKRESVADVEMARLERGLSLPEGNLEYRFLDKDENVMYMRLSSIMARENYRYCHENGWNNAASDISYYYQAAGKEMPEDMETALNGIPSFSEEFSKLLADMKDKGADYLIIDMRGNGGGWTPITRPSLIMMYGDDYYCKDFEVRSIRRLSELYLNKLNRTIDDLNRSWGSDFEKGDYTVMNEYEAADTATLRQRMQGNALTETPALLQELDGAPLYRPKQVFVITDPNTNSAAFHYAFYLWKMGATTVGVPSSQAPNTFMEITPFTLPYTGLTASVSNTMQVFFPAEHPMARVLAPDIKITAADYARHGLDGDTPVLMILEMCGIYRVWR